MNTEICIHCNHSFEYAGKRKRKSCFNCSEKRRKEACKRGQEKFKLTQPYKAAIQAAKKRKKEFLLSENEYLKLIELPCIYCFGPLGLSGIRLDRKNSELPYIIHNVVPCCKDCNMIKNNILSFEEMKVAMAAVIEYREQSHNVYTVLE